jgi:NAD(P)-dependent dehydrogenase (short-subunit alcohol dehydrogenase family)
MSNGTALVTGGAIRLGKAFALSLARAGYNIALHYHRSADAAIATQQEIQALGVECARFPFDLLAEPDMGGLIEKAIARFPDLNVLVNSASVYDAAPILDTDPALFEKQFKANFQAPFFLTQAFAKLTAGGCVVNIIDNKVAFNQFQYAAYLLSKKALADFTQLAAVELAPAVRVNGIAPGVTLPADTRTSDYINWRIQGIPLQRQGTPDNLCQALHYILANDFVNGQILMVDGGESLTHVGQNAAAYEQTTQIKQ